MVKTLRYDPNSLVGDALRGAAGLCITLGPLVLIPEPLFVVSVVMWCLAGVFSVFVLRTAYRHKSEIHLMEDAIELQVPGCRRRIAWDDLQQVKLSYYAVKRAEPGSGIMTLKLRGGGTKIVVESSLKEFDMLAETVARACRRYQVTVDQLTAHNFEALGVTIQPL